MRWCWWCWQMLWTNDNCIHPNSTKPAWPTVVGRQRKLLKVFLRAEIIKVRSDKKFAGFFDTKLTFLKSPEHFLFFGSGHSAIVARLRLQVYSSSSGFCSLRQSNPIVLDTPCPNCQQVAVDHARSASIDRIEPRNIKRRNRYRETADKNYG